MSPAWNLVDRAGAVAAPEGDGGWKPGGFTLAASIVCWSSFFGGRYGVDMFLCLAKQLDFQSYRTGGTEIQVDPRGG
jgi:hypothetical protein